MSMATIVPPINSQGIKTKLVPWINDLLLSSGLSPQTNWIEPFFGTGAVGFNSPLHGTHLVGDTNPHIINFYQAVQNGTITAASMRDYLEKEGRLLAQANDDGYAHYRLVRQRFNESHDPYDFLFLSRAGFNGMMRFNRKGDWNIPFCKKAKRFAPAYITKICNQINHIARIIHEKEWIFSNRPFAATIEQAGENDFIYCDPPYFGRYADYYNGWTEQDEAELFQALSKTKAKFILSTWHHNDFRPNEMIKRYWNTFNITTKSHFYHNGGKLENRHAMTEALVFNFEIQERITDGLPLQLELFA